MEAYQHFVWATRQREPFITSEMEHVLYRYLRQRCQSKRIMVHALNGMPDHVHLVVILPANVAPADFMQAIKGVSSHYINHLPETKDCLYWQEGYGWLTFAKNNVPRIVRYLDRQKERHATERLSAKMELTADWEASSQSRESALSVVLAE